jgi:uncharacterized cupin superfamily protein
MNTILRGREAESYAALFIDPAIGFRYGVTSAGGRLSKEEVLDEHRMVIVQSGHPTVEADDGTKFDLSPGEALVLPAHSRWRWTQTAATLCFDIRLQDASSEAASSKRPVPIRPREIFELAPSAPPSEKMLMGPSPVQRSRRFFTDSTGRWKAGVWTSTPYHRKTMPFPKHEFMYLLSGWLELTTADGKVERFEADEVVFIPKGTVCDWKTEGMSKIFSIFEEKVDA